MSDTAQPLSDEQIIAPGKLTFPNGGFAVVHWVKNGEVYYFINHPSWESGDLRYTSVARFIKGVRRAGGERDAPHGPDTAP